MPETSEGGAPVRPEAGAAEPSGFLYGLPGVLALVLGYSIVHVGLRLLASRNLGEHDPVDNVLTQALAGGYRVEVPPLYDWLLWGLQQVFGPGVESFLLLKYGLLVAIAGFMFLVARRVTGSALWALVAVEGLSLVYQVFWRFHESYTELVGAMALVMAGFWALMRLVERGAWRDYLLFAGLAALGLMTQYVYALWLAGLLAAALLQPAIRARVLSPRMLVLLPLAGVLATPYLGWLADSPERLRDWWAMLVPVPYATTVTLLKEEKRLLVDMLLSLAPFVFFLPLVFPGAWRRRSAGSEAGGPDYIRLIGHLVLFEAAAMVLAVGFGLPLLQHIPVQDYLPMTMLGIVWLTEMARRTMPSRRRLRIYFYLTVFFVLLAVGVRSANMFVLQPVCKICRWGEPYAGLADRIRASGFKGGTIVSADSELAGNLRRFFPGDRVVVPGLGGQSTERGMPILFVGEGSNPDGEADRLLARYAPGAVGRAEVMDVPWHHLWRPTGYRSSAWWLLPVEPAAPPSP